MSYPKFCKAYAKEYHLSYQECLQKLKPQYAQYRQEIEELQNRLIQAQKPTPPEPKPEIIHESESEDDEEELKLKLKLLQAKKRKRAPPKKSNF